MFLDESIGGGAADEHRISLRPGDGAILDEYKYFVFAMFFTLHSCCDYFVVYLLNLRQQKRCKIRRDAF
jgi:hypothetical protein